MTTTLTLTPASDDLARTLDVLRERRVRVFESGGMRVEFDPSAYAPAASAPKASALPPEGAPPPKGPHPSDLGDTICACGHSVEIEHIQGSGCAQACPIDLCLSAPPLGPGKAEP